MSTPEARVKARLKRKLKPLLEAGRVYMFWPVQSGRGARTLDCLLCVDGHFIAIETKEKGKDLTEIQKFTRKQIEDAGGVVFKVDDDESLNVAMKYIMLIRLPHTNAERH